MFNPESVEEIRVTSHSEADRGNSVTDANVPIHQQQLLVKIRDNSLDLHPKQDSDADDMTEFTSRTDDDPVRDAFKFLNTSEDIVDDDEEDQIVWDPRYVFPAFLVLQCTFISCRAPISPVLSPKAHPTPLTPVRPILSPQNLSPRSPTHYQPAKLAFNTPAVAHPPAPATTAQDLLNDVMGLSSKTLSGGFLPPLESTAPQPKFLFGSELSHRPSQSIWSASRDEQPLMYPGNGNSPKVPVGGGGGHIYQTSPRQYSAPLGSQDLSQQSIWSSSYATQSQNSQQNLVGALPSAPFAQLPQPMLVGGQRQSHQRVPSSSVAAQLFPTHNQVQHDPFAYSAPPQPPIHRPEDTMSPSSSGYLNSPLMHSPLGGSGGPAQYYASPPLLYHSRQLSMHDPRVLPQNYMSQVWSNTG